MSKIEIERAIEHFKFSVRPSNGSSSTPATVGDINKLIDEVAKLARVIANSIED